MMSRLPIIFLALFGTAASAFAEYIVTGKFEGTFCTGFGIEVCSVQEISATVGNGQLYHLPDRYDDVDEYRERSSLCSIVVHNSWFDWFIGDVPVFYRYLGGPVERLESYEKLGTPEYLSFRCMKK
jgi:hypothetical protein